MSRILIMEDNPANLDLMTYLLRALGHEVLEAHDGQAGLDTLRRHAVDLVICDMHMPRLDGHGVVSQIRAHPAWRKLPILAVTAMAMVGDREKLLAAGFDGYFSKPIEPTTFGRDVERFVPGGAGARPAAAAAAPAAEEPPPPPADASRPVRATILAVDDRADNRNLTSRMLEPLGYRVVSAGDAREALRLAREVPPDLLITDLHMPRGDGFDLLGAFKADPALAAIPVLIVSATRFSEDDRKTASAMGSAGFVGRPVEPEMLLAEIEACLRRRPAVRRQP